jgi:hypothetical protein
VPLWLARGIPQSHRFGMGRWVEKPYNATRALTDDLAIDNKDRTKGVLP